MQAQEVKQIEASVEDYIALQDQSGYQAMELYRIEP